MVLYGIFYKVPSLRMFTLRNGSKSVREENAPVPLMSSAVESETRIDENTDTRGLLTA